MGNREKWPERIRVWNKRSVLATLFLLAANLICVAGLGCFGSIQLSLCGLSLSVGLVRRTPL